MIDCNHYIHSLFITVLLSIIDDAEYVKAMAEGGGELKHLNTVLHGPPGSGKSSLKRAILGEDPLPEEKQNSTDILENAVCVFLFQRPKGCLCVLYFCYDCNF